MRPRAVPKDPEVLQERPVPRRAAQPDALQRLQRAPTRGVARAREECARELSARFELAQAREAVRGELECRELVVPGGPEGDVEVEDLEIDVCEEEGCGCVEASVGRAPEVGECEGAEGGPAAAEEEVVCDRVEVAWGGARDVADVESLEYTT